MRSGFNGDYITTQMKFAFENCVKNHKILMREYIPSNQFIKELAFIDPSAQYFVYIVHKYITDYLDKPYTTGMIVSASSLLKGTQKNEVMIKYILDNGVSIYMYDGFDAVYFYIKNCQLYATEVSDDSIYQSI